MGGGGPGGFLAKTAFKAEASALSVTSYDTHAAPLRRGEAALIAEGRRLLATGAAASGLLEGAPAAVASASGAERRVSAAVAGRAVSPARTRTSAPT